MKQRLRGAPLADRIKFHIQVDANGCWLWQRHKSPAGYGRITVDGKSLYAHRVSYEQFVGPIPPGKQLDHLCRVRACCNPEHLEPVTPKENQNRGESPGAKARRRDTCLAGHSYLVHGRWYRGRRVCRECNRLRSAAWAAAQKTS